MPAPSKVLTILLVDDEPSIRVLFSTILERRGYAVITAANGHEATELFDQHRNHVSLLLTDLNMPYKNGIELARDLKAEVPALPVIFMTGDPHPWEKEFQGNARLHKPFTPAALLTEVESVLGA